jgi:hyperosmotically inducible periplasmic protein
MQMIYKNRVQKTGVRKGFSFLTNQELEKRVRERIRWDKRVSTADLQIIAREGHIILEGTVDSPYKEKAAQDIVTHTEGVISVHSQIIVPNHFYRTDSELKTLINDQLAKIGLSETESISVLIADGHVKLEGIVNCSRKKAQAAGIVWELSGVTDCLNLIEIMEPSQDNVWTGINNPHLSSGVERTHNKLRAVS